MSSYSIFVSHSHFDVEFCERLIDNIYKELSDCDIFYDKTELHGGDEWLEKIQREVLARPIFIVILSPRSVGAAWVREETLLALDEAINQPGSRWVIPVRHKACDVKVLAPFLSHRQIIDCTSGNETNGFQALAEAIRMTFDKPLPPVIGGPQVMSKEEFGIDHERARRAAAEVHREYVAGHLGNVADIGRRAIAELDNGNDSDLFGEVGHALLTQGKRYRDQALLLEAVRTLDRAIEINSHRPDHWRRKAEAESLMGNLDAALAAWTEARLWTTSYQNVIAIYAEMCRAARNANSKDKALMLADNATELVESEDMPAEFEFGWQYWGDEYESLGNLERAIACYDRELEIRPNNTSAQLARSKVLQAKAMFDQQVQTRQEPVAPSSPPPALTEEELELKREECFQFVRSAVRSMRPHRPHILFSDLVDALQRQGVHYRELAYNRIKEFVVEAERRGYLKVLWMAERSEIFLPEEEVSPQLVPAQKVATKSSPRAGLGSLDFAKVMSHIDVLEKSMLVLTWDWLLNYYSGTSAPKGASAEIKARLEQFRSNGEIEVYDTDLIYPEASLSPRRVEAIRLNREKPALAELLSAAHASNRSAWQNLAPTSKDVLISTVTKLNTTQQYLLWNHLITYLKGQDTEIDWNVTVATAMDEDIVISRLQTFVAGESGKRRTVKSISPSPVTARIAQAILRRPATSSTLKGADAEAQ